jgi:thiosulfate reductase cytochrome b subunit
LQYVISFFAMALIRHNGKVRGLWGILLVPSNLAFGTSLSYHLKTGESVHGTFYWCMIAIMIGDLIMDLCRNTAWRCSRTGGA